MSGRQDPQYQKREEPLEEEKVVERQGPPNLDIIPRGDLAGSYKNAIGPLSQRRRGDRIQSSGTISGGHIGSNGLTSQNISKYGSNAAESEGIQYYLSRHSSRAIEQFAEKYDEKN